MHDSGDNYLDARRLLLGGSFFCERDEPRYRPLGRRSMLTDKKSGQALRQQAHGLNIDEDFEVIRRDRGDPDDDESSNDAEESVSLALIRVLPLVHGGLVGETLDNLVLGLTGGLALSVTLDLCMGNASLVRILIRRSVSFACPVISLIAHRLATIIKRLGLSAPATLHRLKCGSAQSG